MLKMFALIPVGSIIVHSDQGPQVQQAGKEHGWLVIDAPVQDDPAGSDNKVRVPSHKIEWSYTLTFLFRNEKN